MIINLDYESNAQGNTATLNAFRATLVAPYECATMNVS